MTLKEKLKEIQELGVQNIKLGSGSAFFYCGKIRPSTIGVLSAKAKQNAQTELRNRKNFLLEYEMRRKTLIRSDMIENITRWLEEYPFTKPEPGVLGMWWDDAEKHVERLKRHALSQTANLTERLENWVDFLDREVLDFYPSVSEPSTIIVIVQGEEIGTAWATKEYTEKKGNKDES